MVTCSAIVVLNSPCIVGKYSVSCIPPYGIDTLYRRCRPCGEVQDTQYLPTMQVQAMWRGHQSRQIADTRRPLQVVVQTWPHGL